MAVEFCVGLGLAGRAIPVAPQGVVGQWRDRLLPTIVVVNPFACATLNNHNGLTFFHF